MIPHLSAGLGIALALATATACVQTKRADGLKDERDTARAALINPATKATWESEAKRDARDVAICRDNAKGLETALEAGNLAVERLREEGRATTARAEREAQAARKSALDAERRAASVMAARPGADRCASALAILRGEAG